MWGTLFLPLLVEHGHGGVVLYHEEGGILWLAWNFPQREAPPLDLVWEGNTTIMLSTEGLGTSSNHIITNYVYGMLGGNLILNKQTQRKEDRMSVL